MAAYLRDFNGGTWNNHVIIETSSSTSIQIFVCDFMQKLVKLLAVKFQQNLKCRYVIR